LWDLHPCINAGSARPVDRILHNAVGPSYAHALLLAGTLQCGRTPSRSHATCLPWWPATWRCTATASPPCPAARCSPHPSCIWCIICMHSPGRNMVAIRAHMAYSQGACACAGGPGDVRAGPQHQQGPLGNAVAQGGHEVRSLLLCQERASSHAHVPVA
jgi:hypothetical protein